MLKRTPLVEIGLLLFSFLFCIACGRRGFFPLDQSIVFDGAYRIVQGQLPYRDFLTPHGIALFYYQALFFWLCGVNYISYLLAAATLSVIVTWLTMCLVSQAFPRAKIARWTAGLVSAIWVFPPLGTPYPEHAAFLLVLGTVCLWFHAQPTQERLLCFASGAVLGVAFYCKQNVAALYLPLPLLLSFFFTPQGRSIALASAAFLGGFGVTLLGGAALLAASAPREFLQWTFVLPAILGMNRLQEWLLGVQFSQINLLIPGALLLLLAVLMKAAQKRWRPREDGLLENTAPATAIILYFLLASHALRQLMLSNGSLADLGIGVIWGLAFGLLGAHTTLSRFSSRLLISAAYCAILAFGIFLSWARTVHESVAYSQFPRLLESPELYPLLWGEPTRMRDENRLARREVDIQAADLEKLVFYLKNRSGNFFVFPDFTILYGVIGRVPPQPLVWFHKGLTYPQAYDANLDLRIVNSLHEHHVETVVFEESSFFGTQKRLADFPRLRDFVHTSFVEERRFGSFIVMVRR